MKTNAQFRLPKEYKLMLMAMDNTQQKIDTKKLFIQAESTYIENKNRRFKEKISLGDE